MTYLDTQYRNVFRMTEEDHEKGAQYSWLSVEDLKPRPPEHGEAT